MFIKIKKSVPFKVLLYFNFFIVPVTILASVLLAFLFIIYAGFGMMRKSNSILLVLPINESYYDSIDNIKVNITSLDDNYLYITYKMEITLNEDIEIYKFDRHDSNNYEIISIIANDYEIEPTGDSLEKYKLDKGPIQSLEIKTKNDVFIDTYKDFKGFTIINCIDDSTLYIPTDYQVVKASKTETSLQDKNKSIIIACPGSSLKYTPIFERNSIYKAVNVIWTFDKFYFPFIIVLAATVFIGSAIENKKAKKNLAD